MSTRLAGAEKMSQLRHSLRTPLNHIIGYSEILLEDASDPESAIALERILCLARSACEVISQGGPDARETPEEDLRERLMLKSRAISEAAEELEAGNERDVERIRAAARDLWTLVREESSPAEKSDAVLPRIYSRGDNARAEGRILVVDDDEMNRDLLVRHLAKQGYYTQAAEDGKRALKALQSGSFDAVLLDLVMPGMDGLEVLDTIGADPEMAHIAVLMISAADDLHAVADSIQRGAEDYLFKPFDTVLLDARLRATLERKRLRDHERRRSSELERVTCALQRSNEDLQRFAYAASHDLQAPVRTITTYLQLLERRVGPKLNPDELEMIGFAQGAAKRMHELIQDLLTYSRASTAELAMGRVDTQALLDTLVADMKVMLDEAGAQVTSSGLPVIEGDATCLRQVLQNLLSNAVKYRRPQEPSRIHVRATRDHGFWVFSVRDNGQGIAPEYARQIFLMFKRLHGDEIPGSGIGLAICQRIVERFGGRIWVDSEPGHGSTFSFTIPAVDAAG